MQAPADSVRGYVLVTGASSGIGRACALALDALRFYVFAGVRDPRDGDALKGAASERLQTLPIDVTETGSLAAARSVVETSVGAAGLQGLVNNAGIVVAAPLELIPLADLRRQFDVNVFGQIASIQAFLPLLRRGGGRVVNMGSIVGRLPLPLLGPYCASKSALAALTASLRMELRGWGIPVSLVEPGSVRTPIWRRARESADARLEAVAPQQLDLYAPAIAAMRAAAERRGRKGLTAEAVARTVVHALTARRPRARYVVGGDARFQAGLLAHLPDRLRDRLLLRAIEGPRRSGPPSGA